MLLNRRLCARAFVIHYVFSWVIEVKIYSYISKDKETVFHSVVWYVGGDLIEINLIYTHARTHARTHGLLIFHIPKKEGRITRRFVTSIGRNVGIDKYAINSILLPSFFSFSLSINRASFSMFFHVGPATTFIQSLFAIMAIMAICLVFSVEIFCLPSLVLGPNQSFSLFCAPASGFLWKTHNRGLLLSVVIFAHRV